MTDDSALTRRERQIMDVVFSLGAASANDVLERIDDPPSRTAVRTFLRILEEKGHVTHTKRGREYIYRPTASTQKAGRSAVRRVVETFFGGSLEKAVSVYLTDPKTEIPPDELKNLESLIREARKKGR